MKKLIALLLVICMVAGLFVGCKKKTKDPATDPTASVATEATEGADATDGTEAPDATDETGAADETEAPNEEEGNEPSKGNKPTAATRPKKTTSTKSTKATTGKSTKATQPTATKATSSTKATAAVNSKFKGKTLQIYGMGNDESYHDLQVMIDNESTKIYPFIERAAIEEWAALNGVTIEFKGAYDQNTVMSAINAGEKPDVIFQSNMFSSLTLNGIAAAWTNAEYKQLAEICGEQFLDLMKFGTKSYGVTRPWTGTIMCYYNATMFEEYGVKTPKQYFQEGKWNWDAYLEVCVAMTKDTNGDGKMDTYGINGDSWGNMVNTVAFNSKGELVSTINEPFVKDAMQLKYDMFTVKKCAHAGQNKIQTNVISPMFALQMSDCEPYNWQHLYQEIPNGNILEVVPVPEWVGENGETQGQSKLTQSCFHMASTCDEREAVIDLLCYVLKCGLKYVSDYSLGTVACDYEGLQGSCDYSKAVLEALAKINNTRSKKLKALGSTYDAAHVTALNKYLENRGYYLYNSFAGVTSPLGYDETVTMPPESAIPAIKGKYEAAIKAYNDTYIK